MTFLRDDKTIQTNTFGFNVPCRQYIISAARTHERRHPLVDEFVLRTVHLTKEISASRLARFFGFDSEELTTAVVALQRNNLLAANGDTLKLTDQAIEMFRTSDPTAPTLTECVEMHADVWFELVSSKIVSGKGLHNVQNLISLRVGDREPLNEEGVRAAFNDQFLDYLRISRNERDPDRWHLHAIYDVQSGRYSFLQIEGEERLTIAPTASLKAHLSLEKTEQASRVRRLTDAMTTQLAQVSHVLPSKAALQDFARLTETKTLRKVQRADGTIDIGAWLTEAESISDPTSTGFVGYPYIERNRKLISEMLARQNYDAQAIPRELFWLRPGGERWGLTQDLNFSIERWRQVVRANIGGESLPLTLVTSGANQQKASNPFKRIFAKTVHLKEGAPAQAVEVLVIPGILAALTVMAPISDRVSVPIGWATISPDAVSRILTLSGLESIGEESR